MAKGENPVLETLADINLVSVERTELDPASLILIRLAALVAADARSGLIPWGKRARG
jgi:hypothetical protein